MSARRGLAAAALIVAPVVVGGAVAGVLALSGERRMLQLGLALPALPLLLGLVLAAVVAIIVAVRARRRRRDDARESLRAAAVAEGVAQERENHRRFLARLDHELKNPLTAIRATAAAAGAGDESTAWATVDDQARRLSVLVRDLRKLAELETRPLETEQVDLEDMLREAIGALVQQHPDLGARMRLEATRVPWPVPAISADHDLLSLALDNVLGNAAKYSDAGPIEVRLREEHGWAVIEVADSGRGIPASDLPLVFAELARAGNARDVAGSGLGLTLVSTVLARHGGHVSLRSAEGAGSVATLRLPLKS